MLVITRGYVLCMLSCGSFLPDGTLQQFGTGWNDGHFSMHILPNYRRHDLGINSAGTPGFPNGLNKTHQEIPWFSR